MNRFFLGAYWPAREESLDACADRASRFFTEVVEIDPLLGNWHERAKSRKGALEKRADVKDREFLRELLKRGRHWTDIRRRLMKDLGFSFGLWNGQDEPRSIGLHVTCGLYFEGLSNCLTLDLPDELGGLRDVRQMRAVIAAVAKSWEPNWAGVMSEVAMERRKFDGSKPFVDWMLYISNRWLPSAPELKPPASIERLPAGTLIIVQDEPPDPDDPAHLENIKQVVAALRGRVKVEA
ncbi:MAG: Imm52 family immunity protein [Pirellulales bacterium]